MGRSVRAVGGTYRAKVQTMSCGKFMVPCPTCSNSVSKMRRSGDRRPGRSEESAEGTKAFPESGSLTDSSDAVWTFGAHIEGAFYQVLRNGVFTHGLASQLSTTTTPCITSEATAIGKSGMEHPGLALVRRNRKDASLIHPRGHRSQR